MSAGCKWAVEACEMVSQAWRKVSGGSCFGDKERVANVERLVAVVVNLMIFSLNYLSDICCDVSSLTISL